MKDRFSGYAASYAQFRPVYPDVLYEFLFSLLKNTSCAWDAGTGNGQVAARLGTQFHRVIATDISAKQLEQAVKAPNIFYSVGEKCPRDDNSVDLVTVAQALHWFDVLRFFEEATRVLKPQAIIAVWGYDLLSITPEIDKALRHFYSSVVGAYWDAERKMVDDQYRHVVFPFSEIEGPPFSISVQWTLEQMEGYLTTWSAVQKYITAQGVNPVDEFIRSIQKAWGEQPRQVTFPLFTRIGICNK